VQVLAWVLLSALTAVAGAQDHGVRAKDAYEQALAREAEGNQPAALRLLADAAQLAGGDADLLNRIGETLQRMGALDGAVEAYRRAVGHRPGFRKATNNLILALAKSGNAHEALELARLSVAAAPDDADGHFTLGLAQAEQDLEDAIKSFRRALELAPSHALARYNLALALKRADRLSEVVVELKRVIEIEPRPEALYTLGVVYWQQGQLEDAARALQRAVALAPQYVEAYYTLGAVLKSARRWTDAAAALRRAIALRPDHAAARYALAQVLARAGDDAGARTHLAESEQLRDREEREQEASILTYVGIQKLDAGEPASALEHFVRATRVFESYAPAHYQMGRALQRLGRPDESRAAFARAQQLNPALVPP